MRLLALIVFITTFLVLIFTHHNRDKFSISVLDEYFLLITTPLSINREMSTINLNLNGANLSGMIDTGSGTLITNQNIGKNKLGTVTNSGFIDDTGGGNILGLYDDGTLTLGGKTFDGVEYLIGNSGETTNLFGIGGADSWGKSPGVMGFVQQIGPQDGNKTVHIDFPNKQFRVYNTGNAFPTDKVPVISGESLQWAFPAITPNTLTIIGSYKNQQVTLKYQVLSTENYIPITFDTGSSFAFVFMDDNNYYVPKNQYTQTGTAIYNSVSIPTYGTSPKFILLNINKIMFNSVSFEGNNATVWFPISNTDLSKVQTLDNPGGVKYNGIIGYYALSQNQKFLLTYELMNGGKDVGQINIYTKHK